MTKILHVISVLVLITAISCQEHEHVHQTPIWNNTFVDKLKKDLLTSYDRFARPTGHNSVTKLNATLYLHQVDLNERKSLVTVYGRMHFSWTDDKLKWTPSDYGGLDSVHMGSHEVWQPDIILYNSAMSNNIDFYGNTLTIVYSTGTVLWVPPTKFQVFCDLNLKHWPSDVQKCMVKVGSWTYSSNILDIRVEKKAVIEKLMENPQWQILDVISKRNVKFYDCCKEPYADIEYNITMRRRSEMQKAIAYTPITIVILLTLAGFWLPSVAGEKILLNGFNAVILTIFLVYFSNMLPVVVTELPLIVYQYFIALFLVCISLILSVLVIKTSRSQGAVPGCYKNLIDSWYGSLLGITGPGKGRSSAHEMEEANEKQKTENHEGHHLSADENEVYWPLFGALIDRTAFVVYLIIFVVMMSKHLF